MRKQKHGSPFIVVCVYTYVGITVHLASGRAPSRHNLPLINLRRACAARVTVLGLSVRPSACLSVRLLPRFLQPRATNR